MLIKASNKIYIIAVEEARINDTDSIDGAIDRLVYGLYNLSDEEEAVVEVKLA